MSAKTFVAVAVVLVGILAFAWYENVGPSAPPPDSGVKGIVMIGPTCPVVRFPDNGTCANKPYAADLAAYTREGKFVKRFSSGADGKFSIPLLPGNYLIGKDPDTQTLYPVIRPTEVTVEKGKFSEIKLEADSGIR